MKIRVANSSDKGLPTASEILSLLRSHPLVGNVGRVKSVYVIGSFASGMQNDQSDLDVLLEIVPVKGFTADEFSEKKRRALRDYFVKNNIHGKDDSVHPQWNGRRVDVYFTYDASTETRPKVKI